MRIKDEIFCFAHLRWCHNGWASNILIVVDTGYAGIHHSKYWMPIHYDTIEDGQNKKSHLLFSKCPLPREGYGNSLYHSSALCTLLRSLSPYFCSIVTSWQATFEPRKSKEGICCGSHLAIKYGGELLCLLMFLLLNTSSNFVQRLLPFSHGLN